MKIDELNEALEETKTGYADVGVNKTCPVLIAEHQEHYIDRIYNAAKFTRNLLQAIEDGRVAVVPCEATDETNERLAKTFHHQMEGCSIEYLWPKFIKAAPNVVDDLWD